LAILPKFKYIGLNPFKLTVMCLPVSMYDPTFQPGLKGWTGAMLDG